jgi:hypothetical protein
MPLPPPPVFKVQSDMVRKINSQSGVQEELDDLAILENEESSVMDYGN